MAHICSVLPYSFCEGFIKTANTTSLHGLFPLSMDEAYLTFISNIDIPLHIYENNDMCKDCEPTWKGRIKPENNFTYVIGTDAIRTITLENEETIVCRKSEYFTEYGDYYMSISNVSGNVQCSKAQLLQTVPYTAYEWQLPLNYIMIFSFLFLFALTPVIIKYLFLSISAIKRSILPTQFETEDHQVTDIHYSKTDKTLKQYTRLVSLDVFRGLTVGLMIVGNAGAGKFPYFYHNVWDGINVAELPHGWFNWMLGLAFSIVTSETKKNVSTYNRFKKGFCRTSIFFFLGLVVNSAVFTKDLDRIPYFGVLQGMGILSLFVLCMDFIISKKRRFLKHRFLNFLDIGTLWQYYLIIFAATVIQNAILFGLHVPGCGRGYLGPGGRHMFGQYKNCTGGAAGYIDRWIVGTTRMPYPMIFSWTYGTSTRYDTYGPFGLIGQLVQVYLGILAGEIFLLYRTRTNEIFKKWLCMAVILTLISWLLCNATFDYCILPCNRRLWTLTHSCNVGLSALFLFTLLYFIIDVKKIWNGWPLYYLGRNSLIAYVGHILTKEVFPFSWPTPNRHSHLLVQHLVQAVWWLIICGFLHYKKYFFTA